jgi:hypothetical protein
MGMTDADLIARMQKSADALRSAVSTLQDHQRRAQDLLDQEGLANPVAAEFVVDSRGMLTGVRLDRRGSQDPRQIIDALNTAAVVSGSRRTGMPAKAAEALLTALAESTEVPSATASNDLREVSATAQFGDVVAVSASPDWLARTPDAHVADEILEVGRAAARLSDSHDRFPAAEEKE